MWEEGSAYLCAPSRVSCSDLCGLRNSCKISLQEAEKIERLQESIFMNFKFGSSFSNFSSQ